MIILIFNIVFPLSFQQMIFILPMYIGKVSLTYAERRGDVVIGDGVDGCEPRGEWCTLQVAVDVPQTVPHQRRVGRVHQVEHPRKAVIAPETVPYKIKRTRND